MRHSLFVFFTFAVFSTFVTGCGLPAAKVVGKVTCGTKPVTGSILFSPVSSDIGPPVSATLGDDGSYMVDLKAGKYRIVVSPADVVYPAKPGKEYPCSLAPVEKDVTPGNNEISIALGTPGK